jgi:hypothetical protein
VGTPERPLPLIIDSDPGLDDALAIGLALARPELEVLAVTTVGLPRRPAVGFPDQELHCSIQKPLSCLLFPYASIRHEE